MRHGLAGKKLKTMLALLDQGKSVEEVSKWMGVIPSFVEQHVKEKPSTPTPVEGVEKEEVTDPYRELPGSDLVKGKGYKLKDLRAYVNATYGADLPGNSSRVATVDAYLDGRAKDAGAI